jgi:SAM-dependent methyltransferase
VSFYSEIKNSNSAGYQHNFKQVLSFTSGHRNRTERVMSVLKCIEKYDYTNSKMLVIGSRNEAELMLLDAYGFCNINAIDLFSYSPRIKAMDMNDIKYEDNFFDIYYSSYVIKYSPDVSKTISEAIRVVKNGGLIVFAFSYGLESNVIPSGAELSGGIKDLILLFKDHIEHIYWNEEYQISGSDMRAALIFRLNK